MNCTVGVNPESAPDGMAARIAAFDWATTPARADRRLAISLRTAVDICINSGLRMFIWWGPSLINIYNDAYAPVLGKRHPKALGQPAREIWAEIWPEIGDDVDAVVKQGVPVLKERVRLILERNGYPEETFFTYSHSPIPDGQGGIGGLIQVCIDETARVLAERDRDRLDEQRQRADERARTILDSITDAFFAVGRDWRFQYVNPQADRVLGRQPGDLLGKTLWEVYPGLHGTEFERVYLQAMDQQIAGTVTSYYPDHDRWYEIHCYPVREGISIYFRDVTDRKRADDELARIAAEREELLGSERAARAEAERAGRMKDEFLATLSHEPRTPLNAILGWSQILNRSTDPEDFSHGLEVIERNARAQSQIIEDLLDMSRIISGKVRLDVKRVDLAEVVKAAVDASRPTAESKGVRLQAVVDPIGDVPVRGDANRLQQVMWNLLSNAIKFTPTNGQVHVTLQRVEANVELTVSDTGEGIHPDFLPFVFDRFRQADASASRRHGGLGLGLSIIKQLVELHGGSIQAQSDGSGMGARFNVSLPVAAAQVEPPGDGARRRPAPAVSPAPASDVLAPIAGLRVVVIDDEPDARALVKRMLEAGRAAVTTTDSVDEALDLIGTGGFDVLVSDIGMPGSDGYSFIRRVRALGKDKGGAIPAIALTAYARAEDRVKAVSAGFMMHLAKPVERTELVTMVANAAGRA